MAKRSKRMKKIDQMVDKKKEYSLGEAIASLKECPSPKFDQTINLMLKIGVDPRKSDQQVRGTVVLPHGTGKKMRVVVIARSDKVQEALDAGADFAGSDELIEKIKGGWTDFDALIATPDMMRELGKLGKVLGPRGLMPTPKAGTVTVEVAKAVSDAKGGKVEFKVNKTGNINGGIGKISFDEKNLIENIEAYLGAVMKAKPATAKGAYFKSLFVSSTMGPGLSINIQSLSSL